MNGEVLPDGWRWSTLGEVAAPNCRAIVSGPFGSNIGSRFFVEKGIPVIRGNNLTTDMTRFVDRGFVFVTEEKADELGNCEALPGDLVFTAAGSLGQVGLIPISSLYPRYIISNKQLRARLDKHHVDPLFAFYWFASPRMIEYVQQRNTGSSVPLINLSVLRALPLPLPPLSEQRAIAHILGTLDDKIELNQRMNATLEEMARALFKSWFVDFDPVRAKIEGRDTGLPREIADLFPDGFEESAAGEVPVGWGVRGLDETARFLNGLALQKYPPQNGKSLPVIKIAQLRTGETEGADLASADLDPAYIVADGDVLFSWSGSLECVLWAGGPGALNQHLFKVTSTDYPKWFYYFWIHKHLESFRQIAADKATTMGHIQRRHLSDAQVVVPDRGVLDMANKALSPMIDQLTQRRIESRTLAALRDTLLPKLISGELRVPDAR